MFYYSTGEYRLTAYALQSTKIVLTVELYTSTEIGLTHHLIKANFQLNFC